MLVRRSGTDSVTTGFWAGGQAACMKGLAAEIRKLKSELDETQTAADRVRLRERLQEVESSYREIKRLGRRLLY